MSDLSPPSTAERVAELRRQAREASRLAEIEAAELATFRCEPTEANVRICHGCGVFNAALIAAVLWGMIYYVIRLWVG